MTQGQALEQVAQGYEALSPDVRERWAMEQIQTIRNTVAKDLSVAEFQMGMGIAAQYGLDPLLHEIWFAKGRSQDGGSGRTLIMTGRDGFLKIARSRPDFGGIDCDVVRANDEFTVERLPSGEREVHHKYTGSDVERGEIRGAWAIAHFHGKVPFFYYAPIVEYRPRSEKARQYSPWGSQESVMILKCCQSYVLRIACGISGMVGAEEYDRASEAQGQSVAEAQEESLATVMSEVPHDLRDRLYAAYGQAAEVRPGQVNPALIQLSVRDQPQERILRFIEAVEYENAKAAETAEPEDADVVEPEGFKPAEAIKTLTEEEADES